MACILAGILLRAPSCRAARKSSVWGPSGHGDKCSVAMAWGTQRLQQEVTLQPRNLLPSHQSQVGTAQRLLLSFLSCQGREGARGQTETSQLSYRGGTKKGGPPGQTLVWGRGSPTHGPSCAGKHRPRTQRLISASALRASRQPHQTCPGPGPPCRWRL